MFKKRFNNLILLASLLASSLQANLADIYGYASLQGRRPNMEDTHFVKIAPDHAFYGVFDGHGGNLVSRYLALKLYFNIVTHTQFKLSPLQAMALGALATNHELPSLADNQGSTAIMALIKGGRIYVGNVGDSRAVLAQNGVAVALSQDHKPNRPDEYQRIKDLGGFVSNHGNVARLQGVLAVSRAFGDFSLRPYITAQPEMLVHGITPNDEFLILACDGVWDVFSNQQAIDLVRASLDQDSDPKVAAQKLTQAAYDAGSMDNLSAIVIKLN